jgi:Nif-specific regulatory protein
MHYNWPGNVRELQNLIERLVILTDKSILYKSDLPKEMGVTWHQETTPASSVKTPESLQGHNANATLSNHPALHSLEELERAEIKAALLRNGWVQARAARDLGLTQRQIGYRIKKFNLDRPEI